MRPELVEVMQSARMAREAIFAKTMTTLESNMIGLQNHTITTVFALDLRERMFLAEVGPDRAILNFVDREMRGQVVLDAITTDRKASTKAKPNGRANGRVRSGRLTD